MAEDDKTQRRTVESTATPPPARKTATAVLRDVAGKAERDADRLREEREAAREATLETKDEQTGLLDRLLDDERKITAGLRGELVEQREGYTRAARLERRVWIGAVCVLSGVSASQFAGWL